MEQARKTKKSRIVEYSEDESKEDEDSEWAVVGCTNEAEKTAGSGENEPSGTDREPTPKPTAIKESWLRRQRADRRDNREESIKWVE